MKKLNLKKINILIVLVALTLLVTVSLFSFARYVGNTIWEYYLESQGFYFSSEFLDDTTTLNNNWNGRAVSFDVTNYSEDGEVSDFSIEYEITCNIIGDTTGNLYCSLNNTDTNTYTGVIEEVNICFNDSSDGVNVSKFSQSACIDGGYEWINSSTSLNHFFEVRSTDPATEIKDVEVRVEAKSLSPYEKTISGNFKLIKNEELADNLLISHETYNDYEKLIITNNSIFNKDFFLKWRSNKLNIANADNYEIRGLSIDGHIEEVEIHIPAGETATYTFYKTVEGTTITINDFTIIDKPPLEGITISSIELYEFDTGVTETLDPSYTSDSININVDLPSESSNFVYRVTIDNTTEDYYLLKSIENINNPSGMNALSMGLSLYQELPPGTVTTFFLTYNGNSNLTSNEVALEIKYVFEQGELYKEEELNGSTPEIIDGLIPIVYNETDDMWEKADVVNGMWYNYSDRKWANAASVIESKRTYYSEAAPGTDIPLSDITSMLVWIPRYSYTIRDTYGYQEYGASNVTLSTPGAFDIKFGDASILDSGSGQYSGTVPMNYYTSSAFCWGNTCDNPKTRGNPENTEIKGFWIAKFEASKVNNILYSKPNMTPMNNLSIKNTFTYVQELMNGVNGYNNYGYIGEVDAHLIKNTEWGAIAYLSQSAYGKYGNPDYSGVNKEIYLNNCTTYITGIGGSSAADGRTSATCTSANHTYETYNGMGASTTGNIYGVYDMIGGTFDRVMGIILGPNGEFIPDYSGFTTLPEGRYINVYPYGTYTIGDVSPIKGDALTETISFYDDRYLNDPRFSSTNYYDYHWLYRGGSLFFPNTDANGIFSYTLFNGIADGHHASRFAITMYGSIVDSF